MRCVIVFGNRGAFAVGGQKGLHKLSRLAHRRNALSRSIQPGERLPGWHTGPKHERAVIGGSEETLPTRQFIGDLLSDGNRFARGRETLGIKRLGHQGVAAQKEQRARGVNRIRTGLCHNAALARVQRSGVDGRVTGHIFAVGSDGRIEKVFAVREKPWPAMRTLFTRRIEHRG